MAIALDTSVGPQNTTGTSITWSHTCTGSNLILFVGVQGDNVSNLVTGATYNSVPLTLVDKVQGTGDRWVYLFYLINPSTGANNVVVSASGSTALRTTSVSYTGAKQSGQPDAFSTKTETLSVSVTGTVTTVENNCWTVMVARNPTAGCVAGAGATIRGTSAFSNVFDSNGAITPAGSTSLQVTNGGSATIWEAVIASFAPAVTATPTAGSNFMMMGV